eukprot:10345183-Prorocentrum_lima.AAC.1
MGQDALRLLKKMAKARGSRPREAQQAHSQAGIRDRWAALLAVKLQTANVELLTAADGVC